MVITTDNVFTGMMQVQVYDREFALERNIQHTIAEH